MPVPHPLFAEGSEGAGASPLSAEGSGDAAASPLSAEGPGGAGAVHALPGSLREGAAGAPGAVDPLLPAQGMPLPPVLLALVPSQKRCWLSRQPACFPWSRGAAGFPLRALPVEWELSERGDRAVPPCLTSGIPVHGARLGIKWASKSSATQTIP